MHMIPEEFHSSLYGEKRLAISGLTLWNSLPLTFCDTRDSVLCPSEQHCSTVDRKSVALPVAPMHHLLLYVR